VFNNLLLKENSTLLGEIRDDNPSKSSPDKVEPSLLKALSDHEFIRCSYVNQVNSKSEKILEPIKIFSNSHHLYLSAFDLKDRVEKTFRLDRLNGISIIPRNQFPFESEVQHLAPESQSRHILRDNDVFFEVELTLRGKSLAFDKENPLLKAREVSSLQVKSGVLEREIRIPQVGGKWLMGEILLANGDIRIVGAQPIGKALESRKLLLKKLYL
jgi:predicted DNA-binding transcriptional regulator YafY